MKKKILISVCLLMMFAMGVVSGATNWGKFEGYNIVRVLINGKEAKVQDVPAVMLNSRTMVPIYLLRDAGLNVSWDGSTSTVSVSNNNVQNDAVQHLINLHNLSTFFKSSTSIGTQLNIFQADLTLTSLSVTIDTKNSDFSNVESTFLEILNYYKELSNYADVNKHHFINYNINYNSVLDVYNYYHDSLENYENAINSLIYYQKYQSNADLNDYKSYSAKAYEYAEKGRNISNNLYEDISSMIINY